LKRSTKSPHPVTGGERDVHYGGVFGNCLACRLEGGDEKERKIIEGGYFCEVYFISCFVGWSGFVDSFLLCHGAKETSRFRRGKIIDYRCSGKWHRGECILSG
jgi:hypothetical protein